ncbi:MAG: putative two-component system sensor kinase [Nocardioidaceae bacterium]|nr:putative two-component system sensor kinase [Nocardioidaceae bacterium]
MTLSDHALRRLAWAGWWFLSLVIAVQVPLLFVEPSGAASPPTSETVRAVLWAGIIWTFPLTGLLILRHQPRNTIGWLLVGIGFGWGLSGLTENYVRLSLLLGSGRLPRPDVAAAIGEGSWAPGIGLAGTLLLLLYPDGHLPSQRWRSVAWVSAVSIIAVTVLADLSPGRLTLTVLPDQDNPLGLESAAPVIDVSLAFFITLLWICVVACAVALVRRLRRAHGLERLQLKWLAAAGTVQASLLVLSIAATELAAALSSDPQPAWLKVLDTVRLLSFVLLPVAIGIAILRYQLYDLDRVINRALVYGSLTVTLAAAYLGSVLSLQLVLNPFTDQSDLAVAGSTLAVAALFRPARARIQAGVDRRFFRSRYDSVRTLEAFTARLRDQVDLASVSADLRGVVSETVQPVHVTVWLRP